MLDLICSEHTIQQVPESIRRVVVSRAAGNALFGVALVQSLLEAGACRVAGGVMSVDEAVLGAVSVGDKLERVLVSKIDRTPLCMVATLCTDGIRRRSVLGAESDPACMQLHGQLVPRRYCCGHSADHTGPRGPR